MGPYLRSGLLATLALVCSAIGAAESDAELARGERLFLVHCSRCHGVDGAGGEGPALNQAVLRRAPDDETLLELIRDGLPRRGMPGTGALGPAEARSVATYVRSLGRVAPELLPGDPALGRAVYEEQGCASCHIVAGEGRAFGPELTDIGRRRGAEHLRRALLRPTDSIDDAWRTMTATLADGRTVRGLRVREDDFVLVLLDADRRLWSLAKQELREARRLPRESLMPSFARRLSEQEADHLVAYLMSLGRDRP